jgi:hypothetical protein
MYEGQVTVDNAVNPNYINNQYKPINTFETWVESLLMYKNSIPLEIRREILKAYDQIPGINSNIFGNAKVFKRVLKNMSKSRYNQSIASLVKERSEEQQVPMFTAEEIEFIR